MSAGSDAEPDVPGSPSSEYMMALSIERSLIAQEAAPIERRPYPEKNLRGIDSIARVSHDLDELLPLLLDQILDLLHCDTAAVLLLDTTSDQLIARAARGLEEEVRQGVRIPVGGSLTRVALHRSAGP